MCYLCSPNVPLSISRSKVSTIWAHSNRPHSILPTIIGVCLVCGTSLEGNKNNVKTEEIEGVNDRNLKYSITWSTLSRCLFVPPSNERHLNRRHWHWRQVKTYGIFNNKEQIMTLTWYVRILIFIFINYKSQIVKNPHHFKPMRRKWKYLFQLF